MTYVLGGILFIDFNVQFPKNTITEKNGML